MVRCGEPRLVRKELVACHLTKIHFDQAVSEVKDWDDRVTQVRWTQEFVSTLSLNETAAAAAATIGAGGGGTSNSARPQVVRRKIAEVEPEPRHTRSDENVPPIELLLSANCDFSKYKCKTNAISFKDTLMFQTRVYE